MDSTLYDLLRRNHNPDAAEFSHITAFGPHQKWAISDTSYEPFWEKYCEIVDADTNKTKKLCLAEIPKKHMPIIVDFTLKFHPLEDLSLIHI